jgi:PLP dependent protein
MNNESIAERLLALRTEIPTDVQLIAVSKTKPVSAVQEAYQAGQRAFGENKVQELVDKYEQLPKDIQWHLIGHLQTNKVKYIAPFVHLIHAVDSLKLLQEIDRQAQRNDRVIPCLLQFHIANEDTKFGLDFSEAEELLQSREFIEMRNIQIAGLMGMATFTEDTDQIRDEFRNLNNYFHIIKSHYFKFNPEFRHLSMGMSGDYRIAIEEGSNMVRIGSTLFGSR